MKEEIRRVTQHTTEEESTRELMQLRRCVEIVTYRDVEHPWKEAHRFRFETTDAAQEAQRIAQGGGWVSGLYWFPGVAWTPEEIETNLRGENS